VQPGDYLALVDTYVANVLERRAPYRDGHLDLIRAWQADGRIVAAGALGDPPSGALLVFAYAAAVEQYVAADPYVGAGLVTSWRVETWNVV
jgi:uncharacterized protein YciI